MLVKPFKWHPDDPSPPIEPTSKAKLAVVRSYLSAYFDRLNVNPRSEIFRFDLVDGFSGGGTFRDGTEVVSGTPLIMLEESERARDRLNASRTKPLHFDCRFHFVDKAKDHTDHLRRVLIRREYQVDAGNIAIHHSPFREVAETIISQVADHQPRSRRAIFFLDQTGYSQVELALIARIFEELLGAEVILTFAADSLVNYLPKTPDHLKPIIPLDLTESQLHDLVSLRDGDGGRALIQRVLRAHIRTLTGARFDTPFFIRPAGSRRALWFLHLSHHPTARDVMIHMHWAISNTFEHYGPGDFGMLGWDALKDVKTVPLFRFGQAESSQLHEQLLNSLPRRIFGIASDSPVSVEIIRYMFANKTAARFSDLDEVILQLWREKEIEIRNPDGRLRSPALRRLAQDDLIGFPDTLKLPAFSRLGHARP